MLRGSRISTGDAAGRHGLAVDAVRHYQPVAASRNCHGSPGERQRPDGRSVPAPNVGTVPPERDRCGNDICFLFAPDVCFARRRRTGERNRWRYVGVTGLCSVSGNDHRQQQCHYQKNCAFSHGVHRPSFPSTIYNVDVSL